MTIKPEQRNVLGDCEVYEVTKICFYSDAISTRLIIVRDNKLPKMAGHIKIKSVKINVIRKPGSIDEV